MAGNRLNNAVMSGRTRPAIGFPPAVVLINPKYGHNVGAVVRAASCFGIGQVWFTGDRVRLDAAKGERLPREERMKGYADVELRQHDRPFDRFSDAVPVAVELRPGAERLHEFEHPENAVYVFGPEDGSLRKETVRHCHRFVVIPTRHCVNLAAAVYLVLYDRLTKGPPVPPMNELLAGDRAGGLAHAR